MQRHYERRRWLCSSRVLGIVVLLLGIAGLGVPHATHAQEDDDQAQVAVVVRAEPSVSVPPGGIVTYTIRAHNYGSERASEILVHLPYDAGLVAPASITFEDAEKDWTRALAEDHIKLNFTEMEEGESRTAQVALYVFEGVPQGTVLNMWAGFSWSEDDDENGNSGERSSNAAPVLVSDTSVSSPWVWMAVDPAQGPASTSYTFFSDRFMPGEQVFTWLNTPTGTLGTDFSQEVDGNGRIQFTYANGSLSPGTYQMVALGERSELTAITTFVITAP